MLKAQDRERLLAVVLDQPQRPLGGDPAEAGKRDTADAARELMGPLRGNREEQFQVFPSVERVAKGGLRKPGERTGVEARPDAACFREAREINREAVAQVHHRGGEFSAEQVLADPQARLRVTKRLERGVGLPCLS